MKDERKGIANSEGGVILIGVADDGAIPGLALNLATEIKYKGGRPSIFQ